MIAFLHRNWLRAFGALLVGLAVNIWAHGDGKALVVIVGAAIGLSAVAVAEFLLSGYHVARHSLTYRARVIEVASRRKELRR